MRCWLWIGLFLLLLSTSGIGAGQPQRVVSVNLCTDQLLLMLADRKQIASVSHLAVEPTSSFMADEASTFPINHAGAEEILALKPDLVVAGAYTDRALVALLKQLNYPIEVFPLTENIDDIRRNISRMAQLLHRQEAGKRVLRDMDQRLASVKRQRPPKPPRGAFYQPNGYTGGTNTLQHSAMQMAGWHNIAAEEGVVGYGVIDMERLMLAQPVQLFTSSYAPGTDSRGQRIIHHPALQRLTRGRPLIEIDYKYWICGGPMIADAVELLHRSLP